jgi:hypothetical protein
MMSDSQTGTSTSWYVCQQGEIKIGLANLCLIHYYNTQFG